MRLHNHPADPPWVSPGNEQLEMQRTCGDELCLELPMSTEAPQIARTSIALWAERQPVAPWRIAKLRLIVSEVVTNAVRHSGAGVDATVQLEASRVGHQVLVSVTDAGREAGPSLRDPDPSTGGYGLHIVSAEARRWGVERVEGTRVWFTV